MFTFDSKTTVIFGQDTVGEFGTQAAKLDAKKALLVTDKGIIQAGLWVCGATEGPQSKPDFSRERRGLQLRTWF